MRIRHRIAQRRIRGQVGSYAGDRLIAQIRITSAKHRVRIAEHVVRKADPWLIVIVLLEDAAIAVGTSLDQPRLGRIEDDHPVRAFGRSPVPLKSEASFKGEARSQLVVVLDKVALRVNKDAAGDRLRIDAESGYRILLEIIRCELEVA